MSTELENFKKDIADLKAAIAAGNADREKLEKGLKEAVEKAQAAGVGARQTSYPAQGSENGEPNENDDLGNQAILFRKDASLNRFKTWADTCYLMSYMLRRPVQELRYWKQFSKTEFAKAAMSTAAGCGAEWIPTQFSDKVVEAMHLEFKIDSLVDYIDMPRQVYELPAEDGDVTAYKLGEATTDSSDKIDSGAFGTSYRTLTAAKMGVRVPYSEEIDEESIIPMAERIKRKIAKGMAEGVETCHVNGDTATTHMDSNVTSAKDRRKCWIGLRKHAINGGAGVNLSTFNLANVRAITEAMGKWGIDPKKLAYVVGPRGFYKLRGLSEVTTVANLGDKATLLSGQLGDLDGIPIIVTESMPENLNAVGIYDGTSVTTKSVMLCVYLPAFVVGRRRQLTIETYRDMERDQWSITATLRRVLQSTYNSTTYPVVGYGYNF